MYSAQGMQSYTYEQKYGLRDYRGGDALLLEKPPCVLQRVLLPKNTFKQKFGIEVKGYLSQLGPISCELVDWSIVETNPFFCPDPSRLDALDEYMRALKRG